MFGAISLVTFICSMISLLSTSLYIWFIIFPAFSMVIIAFDFAVPLNLICAISPTLYLFLSVLTFNVSTFFVTLGSTHSLACKFTPVN